MKQFTYVITDSLGIHARPAGLLAKEARKYPDTEITVSRDGETVRAVQLMKLMAMGVKQGDCVTVCAQGASEAEAIGAMQRFFEENL